MNGADRPSGIEQMLAESLKALNDFQTGPAAEENAEPAQGDGANADGTVTATAVQPGKVTVSLEPRVMRLDSVTLAEQVNEAVNAALDDLRGKVAQVQGSVDMAELTEQLKEIQSTSVTRLKSFTDSLVDIQDRIARGGTR